MIIRSDCEEPGDLWLSAQGLFRSASDETEASCGTSFPFAAHLRGGGSMVFTLGRCNSEDGLLTHPTSILLKIRKSALSTLVPPPRLELSEWIEQSIRLPEGTSALPGPVRLWPWQREIADAIGDPAVERGDLAEGRDGRLHGAAHHCHRQLLVLSREDYWQTWLELARHAEQLTLMHAVDRLHDTQSPLPMGKSDRHRIPEALLQ
jgi:hypothetical protein